MDQRTRPNPPLGLAACLPLFLIGLNCYGLMSSAMAAERPVSYTRDIRPLLSNHCYACHGPDENKREADLRLDVRKIAVDSAIVPGKANESELLLRITSDDPDEKMPPATSKKPALTPEQIELVRRWIDEGAKFDEHWAYVRPQRAALPDVKSKKWPRGPIDHFIAAAHEEHGYEPSPEADRRTLIRRLYFDLIGLPLTPTDVSVFENDNSPEAYEKVVDHLLASKHFGERMAIYWLDLVRYADTNGIHGDNHRDHDLYRDWVIKAFNENMPYDQFTIRQLAGDLLPNPTDELKVASGYNRLNMTTREGGAQAKEYITKYAADRVRNASQVWLGSTMGCAQCHNHKFDPFTQKDFYSLAAFFADVQETPVGNQKPVKLPTLDAQARRGAIDAEILQLKKAIDEQAPELNAEQARTRIAALEKEKAALAGKTRPILIAMAGNPRMIRILPRGNWLDDSGEVVQPNTPSFLKPLAVKDRRASRADLANWIVDPENPLTARVFVNRLWKLVFGYGICRSLDDFGVQGTVPSHPELLDWLAVEFVESGWNVKHMIKLMVMTSTYRQSSLESRKLRERDPSNVWLSRQNRFRLDAEMVRDNALSVSGLLVRRIGGPSAKPYQPVGYWKHLNFPKRTWKHDSNENQYRRGLYTYWCRTFLHPSLRAFDAPSREECCAERPRSNTPLQALVLLNDPTYVEAARVFAEQILREGGDGVERRLRFAYKRALSRKPQPAEMAILTNLFTKHLKEYQADKDAAAKVLANGEFKLADNIDVSELAAWTSVARVILNLHESITRY